VSKARQPENSRNTAYYCDSFSQIKVYRNQKRGGDALNKPILLLSVIELITQGLIKDNHIPISDDLINTFKKYWAVLGSASFKGSDFALPFFHLKNEENKFWYLKYSSNYDGGRPQTIPKLREDVDYAYLDSELFDLLQDPGSRQELIDSLVAAWFSSKDKRLEDILQVNQDFQNYNLEEIENIANSAILEEEPKFYLKKSVVRNAFFRKAIVHIYDYRCAFCRLKVIRTLTQSIVDGAHIKPFSQFYDSRVNNGISLCKNHHWAFDHGWFGIDDEYKIIVASDLQEESPHAKPMKDFHSEILLLPSSEQYFPKLEALQWHRKNVFRA
jgi:putative restriction endonuclease